MSKLTYHRSILIAAAHPNFIRITNLGHCKLRIINCQDQTDAVAVAAEILLKNAPLATAETIALFQWQISLGAFHDVGWFSEEGVELGADQDMRITFHDVADGGVAPTAGDVLVVTVGYELL